MGIGDWSVVRLEELASVELGSIAIGPFGSRMKSGVYTTFGVPVIRGTNISSTRAWKGDWVYVSDEFADGLPNCNAREGDLVFPHRGSIGEVGIIPDDRQRYMLSTSFMKFRPDQKKVLPLFLFYYFRSASGRAEIMQYSSQVGTPGIGQPLTSLRQFKVPVPPKDYQEFVVDTLSALDDKIDLNRRMNETLEAMARAIFKDWFVDFRPTRAKAEGRTPYLSEDLWNLFPDALDDNDKPVEWRQGTLADVANSPKRGVSPADVSNNTPYIGLEHLPRRSVALSEWDGAGKVSSNKIQFNKGEILFGKLRPYFHKVGIAPTNGICSTDIVVVVPQAQNWGAFALACLSSDDFVDYTDRTSTGTRMPRTNWKTMAQYKICLPSDRVVSAFQKLAQPLLHRIDANIHETSTLTRTRDFLLPKLMSGEIRLPDAEKAMEAVA